MVLERRHRPQSDGLRDMTPPTPPPKRHPYAQWAPDARALDLIGDKWTLLIVRDLAAGPRRFVELQRVLPGISTEQLRSRLNRMVADGLLTRQRYREVPPRVDYELTPRSHELLEVLGALARWGLRWAWTAPRDGEAIDIGAILRVAPGLITRARRPVGHRRALRRARRRHELLRDHRRGGQRDDRRAQGPRRRRPRARQRGRLDRRARPRSRSRAAQHQRRRAAGEHRARRRRRDRRTRRARGVAAAGCSPALWQMRP